jgi:membrane peptidoglycan carboxypeptidase
MSGKTGTTEAHRSSGFVGFTNTLAAANYIYDDSNDPGELCSWPLRQCGDGNLFGGNEPARTWFAAMNPIANNFGDVRLPPTDPRFVDGGPNSRVPSISGLDTDQARQRLKDAGFQVADNVSYINSGSSYGTVVGSSPSGQTIPGIIVTILASNGVAPAPPPPPPMAPGPPPPPGAPPEFGQTVVEIPGLPPITVPVLVPPPPPPPPP